MTDDDGNDFPDLPPLTDEGLPPDEPPPDYGVASAYGGRARTPSPPRARAYGLSRLLCGFRAAPGSTPISMR